ncbi:hypothetical protein CHS0354_039799 [Potamilus streckersoni]|uniref:Cysteine protease n=1 Tax=Potamilus streckersoni TaxID=2493646 RepID=A0AAE0SRB8_9BIVA|nr:hypothetical protein CHS0354_039799 [Potamilus streckersoni]
MTSSPLYFATLTYECGPLAYDDFPKTEQPVYLLGEVYSAIHDLEDLRHDVRSRLWLTYRKNFPSIGGTGPTSDAGWGCMLRCGQMMLAHALILRHLGRSWRWFEGTSDEKYKRILKMFQDKKSSYYSIQQIAAMGVSEGKAVGHWFGPNTIAQVLKKLVVYDEWSSLVIHVAMDNTVIEEDIRCLCKPAEYKDRLDMKEIHGMKKRMSNSPGAQLIDCYSDSASSNVNSETLVHKKEVDSTKWKPLLLVIPLRLGLTETNAVYVDSLKCCLRFRQSVGLIGGKPNHAHWFIGYVGDEMIFLDPHLTQNSVDIDELDSADDSFHCGHSSRMKILELDPSIALGYFCETEADFDDLCHSIRKFIMCPGGTVMFELCKTRPHHWPPYEPHTTKAGINTSEFTMVERASCGSDEEFELVG